MKRLYVVVRKDLPLGLQFAQACHAAREFTRVYPDVDVGENLVVLEVENEIELWRASDRVYESSTLVMFYEPDLDNHPTAFACCGGAKAKLRELPLAGSV